MIAVATLTIGAVASAIAEDASSLVAQSTERFREGSRAAEGWRPILDEGVRLAERAVELDPRNAEARYVLFLNLGTRAERSGVGTQLFIVRRLRSLLDETIELDPAHAHAWEARGEMLAKLPRFLGGSLPEAEKSLQRATELAPDWAKPWLRLAELARPDNPREARELADRARRLACEGRNPDAEICAAAKALLGASVG